MSIKTPTTLLMNPKLPITAIISLLEKENAIIIITNPRSVIATPSFSNFFLFFILIIYLVFNSRKIPVNAVTNPAPAKSIFPPSDIIKHPADIIRIPTKERIAYKTLFFLFLQCSRNSVKTSFSSFFFIALKN